MSGALGVTQVRASCLQCKNGDWRIKSLALNFLLDSVKGGMRTFYQRVVYWLDMLEKDGGYEYLEEVEQYQKRVEELKKTVEEYWRYVDPIPLRPPQ
jgi:hypothetical protein